MISRIRRLIGLGLLAGFWLSAAHAGAAGPDADRDALAARLQALALYAADFTQTVYGTRGEVLETSEGQVRLRRPDFKWVVDEP